MQKKTVVSAVIVIAIIIAGSLVIWNGHVPLPSTETTESNQPPIPASKVPEGWYSHDTYGIDNAITLLSRTKDLQTGTTSEQITITTFDTTNKPEDFIQKQGLVGGSLASEGAQWSWGIYQGHKTFSMTITANGSATWYVYVFGGSKVYEFTLSPNDQNNPNLTEDRLDFWKVITYYSQQKSLDALSRTETLQNCKVTTLPHEESVEYCG